MDILLKAKHWQIFILLLAGLIIGNIEVENEPTVTVIFSVSGIILYSLYPLIIANSLQDYLPGKVELNLNFFFVNAFIWITFYSATVILSDGKGIKFTGIWIFLVLYVFFAYFYTHSFPAKTLRSIETGQKASLGDYLGDFFLFLFLPIGIWFLQPRINKIAADVDFIDEN